MKQIAAHLRHSICLLFIVFISIIDARASAYPDTVFLNGKIITVDEEFNIVEAVAVTGKVFSAVGKSSVISALAGPETEVIDLQGKTYLIAAAAT